MTPVPNFKTITLLMIASTACMLLSGCGNGLSQVSGVVTLDGEPLQASDEIHATVFFQPTFPKGASAAGILNSKGEYSLSSGSQSGIAPGEYLVTVSATQLVAGKNQGDTPIGKLISHPKFASTKTSGLRFEVVDGNNEFDIPIESAPAQTRQRRR